MGFEPTTSTLWGWRADQLLHPAWMRGQDSNLRPSVYETDELPTAPPRNIYFVKSLSLSYIYIITYILRKIKKDFLVPRVGLEPTKCRFWICHVCQFRHQGIKNKHSHYRFGLGYSESINWKPLLNCYVLSALVDLTWFEHATPCLQGRCSPKTELQAHIRR